MKDTKKQTRRGHPGVVPGHKTRKGAITLPEFLWAYVGRIGNGNLSEGIRTIITDHIDNANGEQQ